jgi:Flp pilus assembly protein TadD
MDIKLPAPHVGLGMLYAQLGRAGEARAEYRKYLELAPGAPDRLRVENRLAALDQSSGAH